MDQITPWKNPAWHSLAEEQIATELRAVGRPVIGEIESVKSWGRSQLHTALTNEGKVWIKHSYRLPPGEEVVLARLFQRWPQYLPGLIASWSGAFATETLLGDELTELSPVEDWCAAAHVLAEIAAGETSHVEDWLDSGVRDRRPAQWQSAVEALLSSPVTRAIDSELLTKFESLVPGFITRYVDAFALPATLVHQDSGCCNIHIKADGEGPIEVVIFDWSDVVIGHPVFSGDRLLDQPPKAYHDHIIAAFCEPLNLSRQEFNAMRRSNVLHEVLRYHDELAHLDVEDQLYKNLVNSVQSQMRVLVEHEWALRNQPN